MSKEHVNPLKDLPADIWKEIFLYLDYYQLTKIKQINKYFKQLINDKFCYHYCLKYGYNIIDNCEKTMMINYLGKNDFYYNDGKRIGEILGKIFWYVKDIPMNKIGKYPVWLKDDLGKPLCGLLPFEMNTIVFEHSITLIGPCLYHWGYRQYTIHEYYDKKYLETEMIVYPDTPVGITLKHLLLSIYQLLFDFENISPLPIEVINKYRDTQFDGLEKAENNIYEIQIKYKNLLADI